MFVIIYLIWFERITRDQRWTACGYHHIDGPDYRPAKCRWAKVVADVKGFVRLPTWTPAWTTDCMSDDARLALDFF